MIGPQHTLLYLGHASNEVVETLGLGLSAEDGEGQVVVLEVETDTWQVHLGLDTGGFELLGVT